MEEKIREEDSKKELTAQFETISQNNKQTTEGERLPTQDDVIEEEDVEQLSSAHQTEQSPYKRQKSKESLPSQRY